MNTVSKLFDINLYNDFFFFWPWHQRPRRKSKNKQVEQHQTKKRERGKKEKLLYSKGKHYQNKKTTEWEKICTNGADN